uniref:Uncharacterized protein n=1 Tax=Oryza punctata TaxID=4537 RepID=A0A0E0MPD6_ORYPU
MGLTLKIHGPQTHGDIHAKLQAGLLYCDLLAGLLQDAHKLCPFNSMQCAVCAGNFRIHVVPSCVLLLACKNLKYTCMYNNTQTRTYTE